jgi:hypothetical protein
MADVKYFDVLRFLQDPIDDAINTRFVAVEQVPEAFAIGRHWTPVRVFVVAKNSLLKPPVPLQGRIGMFNIDVLTSGQDRARHGE